jgi:hypothetical protein
MSHFVTCWIFTGKNCYSLNPTTKVKESSLVGCPPYLEEFSSIRNLRGHHGVVTRDQINMNVMGNMSRAFHYTE